MHTKIQEFLDSCKPVAKFGCILFSQAACCAAFGAASGAVGWQALAAGGWTVQGLDYLRFIQAMSMGSAGTGIPLYCYNAEFILNPRADQNLIYSTKRECLYELLCGCCNGLMGTAGLNLPYAEQTVYFAAAGGATGNAILVLGAGLVCVLVNAAINKKYLCFKTPNNTIQFVELPTRPEVLNEVLNTEPKFITPTEAGVDHGTPDQLLEAVQNLPNEETKLNDISAPQSEDTMSRSLELTI